MDNDVTILIDSVEALSKTVESRVGDVDKRLGQIEQSTTDFRTDLNDLQSRVKEMAERGQDITLDEDNLTKLLNDVMDKQQNEYRRSGTIFPHESSALKLPDPFSTRFLPEEFGTMDAGDLIRKDVANMKRYADGEKMSAKDLYSGLDALIQMPVIDDDHRNFCRLSVDIMLLDGVARLIHRNKFRDSEKNPYPGVKHYFPGYTRTWNQFKRHLLSKYVSKADADLVDTITEISDWVPTGFSAEVRELIKIETRVAAAFERFTARLPWKPNIDVSDFIGYYVPEVTAASGGDPWTATWYGRLHKPDTGSPPTFNGRKLFIRILRSGETDESSIVPLLPRLRSLLIRGHADTEEKVIIDGQRTATIDTGDAPAADDARSAWDGLRYFVEQLTGAKYDSGGTLATSQFVSEVPALMGEYGMNPADLIEIPSTVAFFKMLALSEVLTIDKIGPQATVLRGQLASIAGRPVVPSRHVRTDMNASGIYDGVTTTKTVSICVNRRAFAIAEARELTLEVQRWAATDVNDLVSMRVEDFQNWWGTSYNTAAVLYNI